MVAVIVNLDFAGEDGDRETKFVLENNDSKFDTGTEGLNNYAGVDTFTKNGLGGGEGFFDIVNRMHSDAGSASGRFDDEALFLMFFEEFLNNLFSLRLGMMDL